MMPPSIRFATAADGVSIAYAVDGQGPPLVFAFGWVSHLELMWKDEAFRAYFGALARRFQVVRYDARGNGLSEREVQGITLDDLVLDLEAVVDALDLPPFVLYGATFGGLIAMAYAAKHPERVQKLVLEGTYARGGDTGTPEQHRAIIDALKRLGPAAFYMLGVMTQPEPDARLQQRAWHAQQSISTETAVELYTLAYELDLEPILSKITLPALVLHRRESRSVPFDLGRKLASQLPNARFVPLDGAAHNLWQGHAQRALDAIGDFLDVSLGLEVEEALGDAGVAAVTVLFTDMEGSTTLTQQLGDAKAQELVRSHNGIVRDALARHGGSEIKHTGDGIMASFVSTSRALECAIAIQRAVAARSEEEGIPFRVRIGLNCGEPVVEEGDLFGTAVQLARRICDQAEPGQILASEVVRQLVAGKGFLFADLGEAALRGFEDRLRLYEVRWET